MMPFLDHLAPVVGLLMIASVVIWLLLQLLIRWLADDPWLAEVERWLDDDRRRE